MNAFGIGWTCGANGTCDAPAGGTTPVDTGPTADTAPPEDTGPTYTGPVIPKMTINEVLYDPSNEKPIGKGYPWPGDANNDGEYVHNEDEFVELVNIAGATIDISGYTLYDQEAWTLGEPRHLVPSGTILFPGKALVVFGGGKPTGKFGGATVQTATGGQLNLNNANDTLYVVNADHRIELTFDVTARSDDPDESYTRNPDIVGLFEQHADNTPVLFSPGTKVDGTPF